MAVEFERQYSDERLWKKLVRFAKAAGFEVVEKALWLYYAAEDPRTPKWAKSVIHGALGYFIVPFDVMPDALPAVGYSDDLGVLALAVTCVALYVTPAIKDKAATTMHEGFSGTVPTEAGRS